MCLEVTVWYVYAQDTCMHTYTEKHHTKLSIENKNDVIDHEKRCI